MANATARMEWSTFQASRYARIFVQFVRNLEQNPVNTVTLHDWSGIGGLKGQSYYEGLFEIAEDEALILETEIPETAKYWSVLLADRIFNTIEWDKCQSSLNAHQARLDSDGKFRAASRLAIPASTTGWKLPDGRKASSNVGGTRRAARRCPG